MIYGTRRVLIYSFFTGVAGLERRDSSGSFVRTCHRDYPATTLALWVDPILLPKLFSRRARGYLCDVWGIPAYWEQINQTATIRENIRQRFLTGFHLVQDEPRLLLQDFLADLRNYVAILRALASGYRTPTQIGSFAGLKSNHISMYLKNLIATGFVERRIPIT